MFLVNTIGFNLLCNGSTKICHIDIVRECKISISTVYRRVHELEEAGLLVVHDSIVTDDGKKYNPYKSNIKSVKSSFRHRFP